MRCHGMPAIWGRHWEDVAIGKEFQRLGDIFHHFSSFFTLSVIFSGEILQRLSENRASRASFYVSAMSQSGRWKLWHLACNIFSTQRLRAVQPDIISYSVAMWAMSACEKAGAAGAAGAWQRATSFFEAIPKGVSPDVISFNTLLSATPWRNALSLSAPVDLIGFNALLTSFQKGSEWRRALRMLRSSLTADVISFNASLSSICEWQVASETFQSLFLARLQPNVISINSFMSSCLWSKTWRHALQALKALSFVMKPDIVSFTAMNSAGCHWRHGLDVFCAMELQHDVHSFSSLLSSCEKAAAWQAAISSFHGMAPDLVSFNALLGACEKGSEWLQAISAVKLMGKLDVMGFSNLVSSCELCGEASLKLSQMAGVLPQKRGRCKADARVIKSLRYNIYKYI